MDTTTTSMGGESQELGVTRTSIDDLMPTQDGSILATARHRITGGPAGDLRDDSLVEHGGMQITLRDAVKLGLVARDESGKYSDVKQGEVQQADAAEVSEQEALIAQLSEALPAHIQTAVTHEIISGGLESLTSGGEHTEDIKSLALAFESQGFAHIRKAGIDPQEFSVWSRANAPGEIREAMLTHANTSNPSAYNGLIQRFIDGTTPTTASLKAGQYETKLGADGKELVKIPTIGWVSVKAAAKAKLI